MVADAVIYHPAVAHYLRYVATTVGRDKALRTLQYWSRFYAWYLYRTNNPKSSITPYESVKKNLGMARKLMRIGKWVEHIKAAATASDAKVMDPVLRYCAVGRQLGYAMYLLLDNATVLDGVGFKKLESVKKIQKEAYRAWFFGILFNIVAGGYTLVKLRQRRMRVDEKEAEGKVEEKKLERERVATSIQLVSDLADICVPSTALGFTNFDEGFVGLAGTLSSLIGVWSTWKKTA